MNLRRYFGRRKRFTFGVLICTSVVILVLTSKLFNRPRTKRREPNCSDDNVGCSIQIGTPPNVPSGIQGCQYPQMDPWNSLIKPFVKHLPPLKCSNRTNWVDIVNGKFIIKPKAAKRFGNISCQYKVFERQSDEVTIEGPAIVFNNNTDIPADFFRVICHSTSGQSYRNGHAGIRPLKHLANVVKTSTSNGLGLNVLILGFDSVSRMSFMRKLPKTYNYLVNHLEAVVLKGYNIVGDGTPQALIPIFTGKTELELPRPLKRLNSKLHVDVFPLAWRNFSDHGYATAWSEDKPDIGTFTYRMTGFKQQPTHHYMRIFHNLMHADYFKSPEETFCIGDRMRVRVVLDWIKDFMLAYPNKPKFGFVFHNELSHDKNDQLQYADDYIKTRLQFFKDTGLLDQTMLLVMADHGQRYSGYRSTVQGKQEERNPFFSFTLPEWFKVKYKHAYNNLVKNSERLTTPFDIHPTLLDVLNFGGSGMGNLSDRSISLFREIPTERTCPHASIEAHWCNCLQFSPVAVSDSNVLIAASTVVKEINEITENKRSICAKLHLSEIRAAAIFQHTQDMLAFKKTFDTDGFAPELSDETRDTLRLIQLTILTNPNGGLYEATVKQNRADNTFSVDRTDISRINKYGNAAHCVMKDAPDDRKFCFCKDGMPTGK